MAFDKVIDSEKLDGAITATANAIREKAESAEKLEWNIETGFAEAVSAITVDPTKVTILREQSFTGFVVDPTFGAYSPGYIAPALFQLENGKTYHVEWDGTEYECVAYSYSYGGSTIVAIGNGGSLGLPSNGEPFLISYNASFDNSQMFSTDTKNSHTVGIWQKAESGGGDCADLRYVTFMSEDGTVELGKKAVATGDDCADPIARGVFSTPTKESTAQYNYTFYGWATTPNGAADSNWNKAVTEDRTVYANFASVVRYYTITYYDSDGTTVLKTESLAYGSIPNYTPSKDGVSFSKWQPELSTVVGNASYKAQWQEVITFAAGTWADIIRISESGDAASYFKRGDKKDFTYVDPNGITRTTQLVIVGFNQDHLADGSGIAGITMVTTSAEFSDSLNTSQYTSWESCTLRTKLHNNIIPSFPEDLQAGLKTVIKSTRKYVDGTDATGLETTHDKIWVPSTGETGLKNTNASFGLAGETDKTYTYFPSATSAETYGEAVTTNNYWTRSRSYKNASYAMARQKNTSRSYTGIAGTNSCGILFGFCI